MKDKVVANIKVVLSRRRHSLVIHQRLARACVDKRLTGKAVDHRTLTIV